jgi:LytS/YehU family sensor histidine kinase
LENNYESAMRNHLLEVQWQEKIRNDESKKQFAMLQSKYEEEQYQNKITLLQQENQFRELKLNQTRNFNIGLVSLLAIIILMAILFIRQNKIKTKHQTEVIKHKLLRSQLNPHFVFNSIASIQDFIWKKEPSEADQYLTSFAKLMRHVMENSRVDYVPLKREIETIENYLKLQHFRFPDVFDYHLEVDPEIDIENMAIPPMLAQPFIENSIEHGMKHKKSKGNIHVGIILNNSSVLMHVVDDGIGRKLASEIERKQSRDHQSLSTIITHERINMLNKKLKKKIVFKINDLKNELDEPTGTSVSFEIPYQYV